MTPPLYQTRPRASQPGVGRGRKRRQCAEFRGQAGGGGDFRWFSVSQSVTLRELAPHVQCVRVGHTSSVEPHVARCAARVRCWLRA